MTEAEQARVQLNLAREIIASFLLWHDPAYRVGPNESLEKIVAEARAFMWPESDGVGVS